MRPFFLSLDAAQDLGDIWDQFAAENLDAADLFLSRLYDQLSALAESPEMGHRREDLTEDRPVFFWPFRNYLIIYRNTRGYVEVLAFVRGSRTLSRKANA